MSLIAGQKAVLAFDGLDTFATVKLNGSTILETDNMFIPERVDVTDKLNAEGNNELQIHFDSAYLRGWKRVEEHPDHKWGCWNGDNSRLAHLRRPAAAAVGAEADLDAAPQQVAHGRHHEPAADRHVGDRAVGDAAPERQQPLLVVVGHDGAVREDRPRAQQPEVLVEVRLAACREVREQGARGVDL
ncbi:hypothetical protein BN1708_016573, partial [Verticillium longisporum]